ncbi:MAG TPA: hypothetical protein VLI90_11160 [Tepidisphaeraceae bacterium]|nr:hypothetical protein [Tepidisphaeraceae bacterium]
MAERIGGIIEQHIRKRKFAMIEIELADGRVVKIRENDQAWVEHDAGLLYIVASPNVTDGSLTEIIVLQHVAMVRIRERLPSQT